MTSCLRFPFFFFNIILFSLSLSSPDQKYVDIPTSCIGLEDGKYLMKLINDDNYPILSVECSNEYIIINPYLDPSWSSYFTSYIKYHYGVAGATRNDMVNWYNWFIPSSLQSSNSYYLISNDCSLCDTDSYLQKHMDESTFYLSALGFGCFNPTRGWPSCDMDWNTYECRLCHWNDEQSQIIWTERDYKTLNEADDLGELTGVCDFEIRRANDPVLHSFAQCATYDPEQTFNFKPSIGTDDRHCQCYKPDIDTFKISKTISITKEEYDNAINTLNINENELQNDVKQKKSVSETNIVHLTQTDFDAGTYRITKPGTYIIDEDIVFNFNAKDDDPLADDAWWPTADQAEDYPGAMQGRGPFFLGFFAGITIESDDVVLDLNTYTLRMSERFFYSQPFFSIIELATQPFLPQQGPGFFGSDPVFASNLVIKNGVLGLTSHHGIHGNYNTNMIIRNIKIRNFQTHGIQLNGYDNVLLSDIEIGPSTNIAYLNGNYAQLRELLPTLRQIADTYTDKTISFNGRLDIKYTMSDLLNIIEPLMSKAFNFAVHKANNEEDKIQIYDDDDWEDIYSLFINPSGLSYGAVTYGLFLNYPSAGIFGWHVNDAQSTQSTLENVYIHDIERKGNEIVGLSQRDRVYCNAFNGPLSVISMLGGIDKVTELSNAIYSDDNNENVIHAEYVGDIVSDIHIAMYEIGKDNFDYWPGIPYFGAQEGLLKWAKGEYNDYLSSDNDVFDITCNNDAMFHPSKGLLGIKVSGSTNVVFNGVHVENLIDYTDLGHNLCGNKDLYHFSQQKPYQIGYSMNMVHGIAIDFSDVLIFDDLRMNGIYSKTGLAFGISSWYDTKIVHKAPISISNVYAGYESNNDALSYNSRPNRAAEACAIHIYSSDLYKVQDLFQDGATEESAIKIKCIEGNVGCFGDSNELYTNLGSISNEDLETETEECQKKPISHNSINSINLLIGNNDKNLNYSLLSSSIFIFIIIALLCLSKKIYYDYSWNKMLKSDFKYALVNTKDRDNELYGTFDYA